MTSCSSRLGSRISSFTACAAAILVIFAGMNLCGDERPRRSSKWVAPANPDQLRSGELRINATPNVLPLQSNSAIVDVAGDDDGFGFGYGWIPPLVCETFDNRGPEDRGVFDQRKPSGTFNSICNFIGRWTHSFVIPPGGGRATHPRDAHPRRPG